VADAVHDEALSAHTTAGTAGKALGDVNTKVNTSTTETTAIPSATSSLEDKVDYIFKYFRNKMTQTSTTQALFNDDASSYGSRSVTDDGTTTTVNKAS
jgi:hypothetical protein